MSQKLFTIIDQQIILVRRFEVSGHFRRQNRLDLHLQSLEMAVLGTKNGSQYVANHPQKWCIAHLFPVKKSLCGKV